MLTFKGFDDRANISMNDAFAFAANNDSMQVNSAHLMFSMIRNTKIAKMMEDDTGISSEAFIDAIKTTFGLETLSTTIDESKEQLEISNISEELYSVICNAIEIAEKNNKRVTLQQMYAQIIKTENTSAWKILEIAGATFDNCIQSISNPLASMPITSQYAVDYNMLAKRGHFDPIEARDKEINQAFEIMGRRLKNNPCLVGEAGVGKTAIVEGMAQKLISGDVPKYLKGKHIIAVDISGMISGAKYRGDFEERLNGVLNEAALNKEVILFFDEFHMLADAGGSNDSAMSASNIIKPAISRGDVQIIGATTTVEYKKFIEKDKAFERRMQTVLIGEPSVDNAIKMVGAVMGEYNKFHGSIASQEAVEQAVILSDRYITDKKLPDKAITIIDETAARLKKNNTSDKEFNIEASDIKETVSKLTGIDISELDSEARNKVKELSNTLMKHVIGQEKAVESVSQAIRRSKAGIKDPNRPIGSFLFVGPTGVGKTELSKALAIEFSGGIKNLIRIDMTEFMEKHSVSKLIGSPPGYVGYGEGGRLTEAVRHNPYSVVLFDEIEKAHPDVFNILLQVMDDGILTDSEGTQVDFKNTVVIMTSNTGYGANLFNKKSIGFNPSVAEENADKREEIAIKALEETFRPEFLNRLDKVVVFNNLTKENSVSIIEILLTQLKSRLKANNITVNWEGSLIDFLIAEGFSEKYGARNLKRKIQTVVEDAVADKIINEEIKSGETITISYSDSLQIKKKRRNLIKEADVENKVETEVMR